MKKIVLIGYACYFMLLGTGCSEIDINGAKCTGQKPAPVTEYSVSSLYGGAKITFKMPESEDLLYVKAKYTLGSGLERETKSSLYKNYLTVDGFEKAGEFDINLYAVAKGEVESEPTIVKVTVLTPPYEQVFNKLNLIETFGGVNINATNESKADLSITLLEKSPKGEWVDKYTHYTNSESVNFSVRGYEPKPANFAVFVKDRWGNVSDTLAKTLQPIFEEKISKTTWKKFELPGDHTLPHPTYNHWTFEKMWDDKLGGDDMFHTAPMIETWPMPFTIDLGKKINFSRLKLDERQSHQWKSNTVKLFEVYGSNNPSLDGSWDCWTKMGTFEVIKPSGLPDDKATGEDNDAWAKGFDFEFLPTLPSFRYVRFKILETWGRVQSCSITELTFWGKEIDENQ